MIGLRRLILLALAGWHQWRAERDLDAGKLHRLRAQELKIEADFLTKDRRR